MTDVRLQRSAAQRDPAWAGRVFWLLAAARAAVAAAGAGRVQALDAAGARQPEAHAAASWRTSCRRASTASSCWLVARETWRTVAIATAGLALALVLALPLTLLSVRVLSLSGLAGRMAAAAGRLALRRARRCWWCCAACPNWSGRWCSCAWSASGPTAGVLAIALTYGGMLGKVYGEILESGDAHATSTLLRNGAGRLQAFFYGLLPQNAAELTSYTVYRWECAIRSSAVLGFVGAGGLGQQMDSSMKMFNGGEVSTMLLVFVLLVALTDRLSAWLRKAAGLTWTERRRATAANEVYRLPPPLFDARCRACWFVVAAAGAGGRELLVARPAVGAFLLAPMPCARMGRFMAELLPPDTERAFLRKLLPAALETLAMSVLGTLAGRGGRPAAGVAGQPGPARGRPARWRGASAAAAQRAAQRARAGVGRAAADRRRPGPVRRHAGAGAAHHRRAGPAVRRGDRERAGGPGFALRVRGVGEGRVFLYATLPQVLPQLISYTLYRWENNIRAAAVLGVVGAGGLGQMLAFHLGLFQMAETGSVLAAMLVLVLLVDVLSYGARRLMSR